MTVVTYGETARFKAAVAPGGSDGWSVTWQRLIGDKSILIDTNENKFAKSTDEQLVIQPVCMEDDGKYQAAVYRNNIKTSSKTFFLHVVGGTCIFFHHCRRDCDKVHVVICLSIKYFEDE